MPSASVHQENLDVHSRGRRLRGLPENLCQHLLPLPDHLRVGAARLHLVLPLPGLRPQLIGVRDDQGVARHAPLQSRGLDGQAALPEAELRVRARRRLLGGEPVAERPEGRHLGAQRLHELAGADGLEDGEGPRPLPPPAHEGADLRDGGRGRVVRQRHLQAGHRGGGRVARVGVQLEGPGYQARGDVRGPGPGVPARAREERLQERGGLPNRTRGLEEDDSGQRRLHVLLRDGPHRGSGRPRNDGADLLALLHAEAGHCVHHLREGRKVAPPEHPLQQPAPAVDAPGARAPLRSIGHHSPDRRQGVLKRGFAVGCAGHVRPRSFRVGLGLSLPCGTRLRPGGGELQQELGPRGLAPGPLEHRADVLGELSVCDAARLVHAKSRLADGERSTLLHRAELFPARGKARRYACPS
mmetsp:Transcript_99551/g.307060  ORF Transcript_99551/g.307060 Transcript_99551/m.307060 type:complete len:413 (-) Transcript_99551:1737-2975(-)